MRFFKNGALVASLLALAMLCSCEFKQTETDATTTEETATEEATAPETTAPEATAPETTAPETTAPETTAPETTAPETTAPEATAPEATASYPDGFDYTDTDLSKYITLGEYKENKIEITMEEELPEEELAEIIAYYRLQYATTGEPVTDRPAMLTDTVNIDYVGTLDGVAFEGGTGNAPNLVLGSGSMIPGFEEGIVGMSVGDVKVIDVTFPETYHAEDLAGKDAQFEITLHSIAPSVLPEYNDEFISKNFASYGFNTVRDFEQYFVDEYAYSVITEKHSALLEVITKNATVIDYPEGLVSDYSRQQINTENAYATSYQMSLEEYVSIGYQMTLDEYYAYVEKEAKEMIAKEMAVFAIAAAENITASEEEIDAEIASYLDYYGYETEEELIEETGMSEKLFINSVKFSITYSKVLDLLMENTTFIVAK